MSTEAKETENVDDEPYEMNIAKSDDSQQQFVKNESTENILKQDEKEQDGFEIVIELPRDILTAYILCQLSGAWAECTFKSRLCIWFGLYGSYTIQFAVFASLVAGLDFSNFDVAATEESWGFNLAAIAVLFMYLWRDVIGFYNSVWFWVSRVEKDKNFSTFSKITRMKNLKNLKNLKKIKNITKVKNVDKSRLYEGAKFWQYKLFLIAVFVMYAGFALYSLVAIGNSSNAEGIIGKLTVAIQVFFVLEIDDWANDLFIIQPGILDDSEFDIDIVLKGETEEDNKKRAEKRLIATSFIIVGSIVLVYLFSNFKSLFGI